MISPPAFFDYFLGYRRTMVWAAGILLLFGLNLIRDLRSLLNQLAWEPISLQTLHVTVSSPGVMEAINVAELKSEVEEIVLKKHVQEGEDVKKGQLLFELSRTRTQLEYEQKKNAFRNAEGDYKKAVREEGVQERLFKDKAVSRSQWEDAIRARERAQASRDIALQEFELAREKLNSTHVRSPIDGVILKDHAEVGKQFSPGKEMILVGDISKFLVRTKVDELDIKQVKKGQPVEIWADAYPGQPMKGRVRQIAIQAEREAFAKIEVLIDITDARGLELRHNLSVRVHILTDKIPNAIGIPIKAIEKKQGQAAWVLVRSRWGFVRNKKVTLGRPAGDLIEVTSGLKEGGFVGYRIPGGKE